MVYKDASLFLDQPNKAQMESQIYYVEGNKSSNEGICLEFFVCFLLAPVKNWKTVFVGALLPCPLLPVIKVLPMKCNEVVMGRYIGITSLSLCVSFFFLPPPPPPT